MAIKDLISHIYSDDMAEVFVSLILHNLEGRDYLLDRGKIVDFGCGSAKILHLLKERYPKIEAIGVDLDPFKRYDDVRYVTADMRSTGIHSNSANMIISVNVADLLLDKEDINADQIFQETNRILIPRGVYIPCELSRDKLITPFVKAGYKQFGCFKCQEKPS